ncbi:MAG: hypothetical protein WC028_23230 [Candidatus Obscuribacterales bacterium]
MSDENLTIEAPARSSRHQVYWTVLGCMFVCFLLSLAPVRCTNAAVQGIKDSILFFTPATVIIYTFVAMTVKAIRVVAAFLMVPVVLITLLALFFYSMGTAGTSIGEQYNVGKHRLEKRHHFVFNQGGDDELYEVISISPGLEYCRELGRSSWQGPSFSNIKTINPNQIEIEYTNGTNTWTEKIDL